MSEEELIEVVSDTSDGVKKSVFNERTIGRIIFNLKEGYAKVWLLREKDAGWVEYPLDFING